MAILRTQGRHFSWSNDNGSSKDDPPRDPRAYVLTLPFLNDMWVAQIRRRNLSGELVWVSRPRDTPEAVAFLAKLWYAGKPDITDARRRVKNKDKTP